MTRKQRPHRKRPAAETAAHAPSGERLQKVLSAAGIGSRRQCEELIVEGRVEVDGQTATELGVRVDPLTQDVRVDGTRLSKPKRLYYMVNKPVGVVCTNSDPSGRMRLVDLVDTSERLFSIGRLDRTSEGLILLTNDGEFANRIAHPRYGVHKTYRAMVAGKPKIEDLQRLMRGVYLAEGVARVLAVHIKKKHRESTELEIVLDEGRNREIRRVLARIGHKVLRLKRIAIGPLRLADLTVGSSRRLNVHEIRMLDMAAKENAERDRRARSKANVKDKGTVGSARSRPNRSTPNRSSREAVTTIAYESDRYGVVLGFEDETKPVPTHAPSKPPAPSRRPGPKKPRSDRRGGRSRGGR